MVSFQYQALGVYAGAAGVHVVQVCHHDVMCSWTLKGVADHKKVLQFELDGVLHCNAAFAISGPALLILM